VAVVGADVGGSKLSTVLVAPDHTVLHRTWDSHGGAGFAVIVDVLQGALDEQRRVAGRLGYEVGYLGVALAAWLSPDCRTLILGANIGARDLDVQGALEERLGLPVVVENDGNATALAEYQALGSASRCFVAITFGTGVGGGVIEEGRLRRGAHGLGGELGHIPVAADGPECFCGGSGCLETFASGPALARAGGARDAEEVVRRARQGDEGAGDILRRAGRAIGTAVKCLVPVVGPDVVVLCGTVAHAAAEFFLPAAREEAGRRLPLGLSLSPPPIEEGRLGPLAGALGAAVSAASALAAGAGGAGPVAQGTQAQDGPRGQERSFERQP
jgi:glucokinase